MSRFLKLTQLVINTSKIGTIEKKQNKYYVNLLEGTSLSGFLFFGSGILETKYCTIEICKEQHSIDYQIMEKWVNNLK
jgi:hypothetical protein